MGKMEMPTQAMRELLDERLRGGMRISREDLDREATAANLGEDVTVAIHELPPGKYTKAQLEAELLPAIEHRVRSHHEGLGGGPSEPSGKKGSRQGTQRGRR